MVYNLGELLLVSRLDHAWIQHLFSNLLLIALGVCPTKATVGRLLTFVRKCRTPPMEVGCAPRKVGGGVRRRGGWGGLAGGGGEVGEFGVAEGGGGWTSILDPKNQS